MVDPSGLSTLTISPLELRRDGASNAGLKKKRNTSSWISSQWTQSEWKIIGSGMTLNHSIRKWLRVRFSLHLMVIVTNLPLEKIVLVIGVLRRTVVSDCCFDNLCGSHLQSQVLSLYVLTLKMASVQVVETSVPNNSPSRDSNLPDDLFKSRYVTLGFKLFFLLTFLSFRSYIEHIIWHFSSPQIRSPLL